MEELISVFPENLRNLCRQSFAEAIGPEEIRLRIGQPVMVIGQAEEYFWKQEERVFSAENMKGIVGRKRT